MARRRELLSAGMCRAPLAAGESNYLILVVVVVHSLPRQIRELHLAISLAYCSERRNLAAIQFVANPIHWRGNWRRPGGCESERSNREQNTRTHGQSLRKRCTLTLAILEAVAGQLAEMSRCESQMNCGAPPLLAGWLKSLFSPARARGSRRCDGSAFP